MAGRTKTAKTPPFPLWLHTGKGLWAKKIRGRMTYFGKDRDAALAEYVRTREDLEAGRVPRPKAEDATSVREAVNQFLNAKRQRVDSGELTPATWSQYFGACSRVVEVFKPERAVPDLRPSDFAKLRSVAAEQLGPRALGQFVTLVRTLFTYAYNAELIEVPVRFGNGFDRPPKRMIRLARQARGPMLISASDLRRMIDAADVQMKAFLLLGINCGFGSSDCSRLNRGDLTTEPGWLNLYRKKTAETRRCRLWPETVAALASVEPVRPNPKDAADADAVFLTRMGKRWVRVTDRSAVGKGVARRDTLGTAFERLALACAVTLPGRFGVLRHTFRTVADAVKDRVAIRKIMGHADGSIDAEYREIIEDIRLTNVADYVRSWLFGDYAHGR